MTDPNEASSPHRQHLVLALERSLHWKMNERRCPDDGFSPAGVIKFDSSKPTQRLEGYGTLGFGRYSAVNAEGAVNVPVSSELSLRASLLGAHGRDYKGNATLFRANIIKKGTNDLVDGFDPAVYPTDGLNVQTLRSPQDGYAVQHQTAKSYAVFGSLNYAVSPALKVRGGVRYTDDKKDFDAIGGFNNLPLITANPKATHTSWDLGANYTLDTSTSLFARVATGYRAPSIQGRVLFGSSISIAKPEKALSVEAGFKTEMLNKTLRISGTVFSYRVNDLQLTAGPVAGTVLIGGNPLPRAPKWVANWTLKYSTEVANGSLYVLTDWAYRSEYNMFLYKAAENTAKSLLEGGLRVGYGWADGRYEVAAYGRNITDRRQVVAAIDFNNLTGIINEPRSYGVQFRVNF